MNTREVTTVLKGSIQNWFNDILSGKYTRYIVLTLGAGIILATGFFGYRFYTKRYEEAAFQLFTKNVEEFERMTENARKEDWGGIALLFKAGHDQYSRSALAPLFLAYQSQALLKQDNKNEAVEVLEKAVHGMNRSNPVYGLYKTKLALMKLDSQDPQVRENGVEILRDVANDSGVSARDAAAYYLGLHYWDINDMPKAKEAWESLVNSMKDQQKGISPWALLAQTKLVQIS